MSDDRTLPPTAERLRRALREGDSPISSAFVRMAVFAAALLLAPGAARAVAFLFGERLRAALAGRGGMSASTLASDVAALGAPFLVAVAAVAAVAGLAQTGGVVVVRRPASPLSRLTGKGHPGAFERRVVDALRGGGSGAALLILGVAVARSVAPDAAASVSRAEATLGLGASAVLQLGAWALGLLAVFAAADLALQRTLWRRRWRLSLAEAKRERRDDEGAPEVRRARRRAHEELTRR